MTTWQRHDGKGCPVPPQCRVRIQTRNGCRWSATAGSLITWEWGQAGADQWDVVAYCMEPPKGMDALSKIVENPNRIAK